MDTRSLLNGPLRLRHFILATTIADHGSIVRAAEYLYVTQPVISRGLRELEEILGVPLFERGPRGVTPTLFADAFLQHARAILGHVQHASQQIAELADATVGEVTVGTHVAGGNLLLPRAIALVKAERPNVTVRVREATPDRLTDGLVSGELDMIIGRLVPQSDDLVRQFPLYYEPFRVVARVGHPALELDSPTLVDLHPYPWVLPVQQTALRGELEEAFTSVSLELPSDRVECSSPITLSAMVAATDFLAVLPQTLAVNDPALIALSTRLPNVHQTVGVTIIAERRPTPSGELMLSALQDAAAPIRDKSRS